MPSRLGVVAILAFWLAVTGYVLHRELGPRLYGDAPPAIRIDLSDEATQTVPARWAVYRGNEFVGTLTTRMQYVPDENTFRFVSTYKNMQFAVGSLRCTVPDLETTMTVTRAGELRGQTMAGKLVVTVMVGLVPLKTEAKASVVGVVEDGFLVGRCELTSPLGDIEQPLDPTPVPGGQVLNPLQPVSRLRDVRPGQRWVIHEVNPLADALAALAQGLLKKHTGTALANFNRPPGDRPALIAQVSDRSEVPPPPTRPRPAQDERPECWVITYRGDQATARTWVRVSDGKVMLQEATGQGESLRLERED